MRERAAPAIVSAFPLRNEVFQDDPCSFHRTPHVLQTVTDLFAERVPTEHESPKFDDALPIENVWGIICQRMQNQEFETLRELKEGISEAWKSISHQTCRKLIQSLVKRCQIIVAKNGARLNRDDYKN